MNKAPKQAEIEARRARVERLHALGYLVPEIAAEVGVDERTVSRDIQENRKARLAHLDSSAATREWMQDQLADTLTFLDHAKRNFCRLAEKSKSDAAKIRALQAAVEIELKRMDAVKTLIWSASDIKTFYDMERIFSQPPN